MAAIIRQRAYYHKKLDELIVIIHRDNHLSEYEKKTLSNHIEVWFETNTFAFEIFDNFAYQKTNY